jgi:hypothetical protein
MEKTLPITRFDGGISESEKEGINGSSFFSKRLQIHQDPNKVSVLPATVKMSGTTVTGLIKWIVDGRPYDTNTYFYDSDGKIYRETSGGTWSVLRTVSNSKGQGMCIHDDYLYYVQNTQIGRYGPLAAGSPTFTDNWQTSLNDTSAIGFAPLFAFKEGFALGHKNKLAWWDGSVWDDDRLLLPPGLNIRSIDVLDEFLAIGTFRGTNMYDNEEGFVFFWDGTATTFNNFIATGNGGVNAIVNTSNNLFSVIGSRGGMYLNYLPFDLIQELPKLAPSNYVEVFPGAITTWKGKIYVGFCGNSDSSDIIRGVYCFGSKSSKRPGVLSYDHTISTGTEGSNVKIGAVKGRGNYLYIAWQDDSTYGVDRVSISGNPYATGEYETLILDNGDVYNDKQASRIKATHFPLLTGESIGIDYKQNRESSYQTGVSHTYSATDDYPDETNASIPPEDSRFKEWQVKVTLGCSSTTSPTITSIGMLYNDLREERAY